MRKRSLSLILAAAMMATTVTGCGGKKEAPEETTALASLEGIENATPEEFTYPMEKGEPLTYWAELTTNVSANWASLGDTPFGKGLMKNTGVDINFLHPPIGQHKEQFSLILADGNLPDVMEWNWTVDYPGGPEKAIKDGIIIPLNDVFEKYCPNIVAYLKENPEIDRAIKTDEGHYYCFPFIRGEQGLQRVLGLMVRQDWLDEIGMEVPTTIDEWHTVLTAFKEKGVAAPYTTEYTHSQIINADPFAYAFNTTRNFYLGSDGKVHFGAAEPGYKEYLATMAQWYAEGLIDPDLATLKLDQVSAKMTNGDSGASVGFGGSRMGTWTSAARATNPDYKLVPCPVPTLEKGATAEMGYIEPAFTGRASVAITTSCKDVERAARLLDYGYSEEGHVYYNFGEEGVSFEWKDGYPTYTDLVMKSPDGLPPAQAMASYMRGNYNGPFVQDIRYLEQYYTLQEQKDTVPTWDKNNGDKHALPPITPTAEESKEFSTIMNEINTYRDEMTLKFIFGQESIDNFDKYVENIKSMGLERALEIQNAALERYNAR